MALQKKISLPSGAEVSYHKVTTTNIDWITKRAIVVVSNYINQTIRTEGKKPLTQNTYIWQGDNFPYDLTEQGNIVSQTYDKLKALPEFTGALDV